MRLLRIAVLFSLAAAPALAASGPVAVAARWQFFSLADLARQYAPVPTTEIGLYLRAADESFITVRGPALADACARAKLSCDSYTEHGNPDSYTALLEVGTASARWLQWSELDPALQARTKQLGPAAAARDPLVAALDRLVHKGRLPGTNGYWIQLPARGAPKVSEEAIPEVLMNRLDWYPEFAVKRKPRRLANPMIEHAEASMVYRNQWRDALDKSALKLSTTLPKAGLAKARSFDTHMRAGPGPLDTLDLNTPAAQALPPLERAIVRAYQLELPATKQFNLDALDGWIRWLPLADGWLITIQAPSCFPVPTWIAVTGATATVLFRMPYPECSLGDN